MNNCENCYYYDLCSDKDRELGICEWYAPISGEEDRMVAEYEESLVERVEEYEDLLAEMND